VKAESFFQLLKFHDQKRRIFHFAGIRNSNFLNKVEELGSEPIERAVIILKLTNISFNSFQVSQ